MVHRACLPAACSVAAWLAAACATPEATPRLHTVAVRNFGFEPGTLEVAVGDTVVWTNNDVVPHTVTSHSRVWDSGSLAAAEEWRLIVREVGSQPYVCTFHPNMRGSLVGRD